MRVGDLHDDLARRALVVGILITGDDPLLCRHAEQLVADGADVLEVAFDDGEDPERLVEAVDVLSRHLDVPLAVATGSPGVARACLRVGAAMVRDARGVAEPALLDAVAEAGAIVVVLFPGPGPALACQPDAGMAGQPDAAMAGQRDAAMAGQRDAAMAGQPDAAMARLMACVCRAEVAGVASDRIIVEAAVDLGKSWTQLVDLGYPVQITAVPPAPAEAALGLALGCRLVRTRDVLGARRACDVIGAILAVDPTSNDHPAVAAAVRSTGPLAWVVEGAVR